MTWFAAIDAQGLVVKSFSVGKPDDIKANTPPNTTVIETSGMKEPGTTVYKNGVFSALAIVETAEDALTRMLGVIDDEREERMMAELTPGGAKKLEYAEKAREVRDYRSLSGAVVSGLLIPLNIAGTRERFAWSMAEVDETGDSLETVITRIEGRVKSTALTRRIAARAQKLKRQIRAAPPATRDAIFNARSWPTS